MPPPATAQLWQAGRLCSTNFKFWACNFGKISRISCIPRSKMTTCCKHFITFHNISWISWIETYWNRCFVWDEPVQHRTPCWRCFAASSAAATLQPGAGESDRRRIGTKSNSSIFSNIYSIQGQFYNFLSYSFIYHIQSFSTGTTRLGCREIEMERQLEDNTSPESVPRCPSWLVMVWWLVN